MYKCQLLQMDETPVRVTKEKCSDGSQHYMWVYRTVSCFVCVDKTESVQGFRKEQNRKRICLSSQPGKISQSIPGGWKCTALQRDIFMWGYPLGGIYFNTKENI